MISHIETVLGIWTNDSERAYDFFVNKLGFQVKQDVKMGAFRWLELLPPGAQTALLVSPIGPEVSPSDAKVGVFTNIIFACEDIQATYVDMVAKGVTFTEKPTAQPWGKIQAIFEDADQNTFRLVQ